MSSKQTKRCPNCGANNPSAASQCAICDTLFESPSRWSGKGNPAVIPRPRSSATDYDPGAGEDDLLIQGASSTPLGIILGGVVVLVLIGALLIALMVFGGGDGDTVQTEPLVSEAAPSPVLTLSPPPTAFPTNTRSAPITFPTITEPPATYTFTPTEGPCVKTARAGDTLYGLAQECGHRDLSIVDVIVETNAGLDCDSCLREGQTVEIPWPTSTPGLPETDPESENSDEIGAEIQSDTTQSEGNEVEVAANEFGTPDALATFNVEPTLRSGLMWHTISEGETMISIASQYHADAKVLSDINPEVDFPQCDFSARFGGPNCSVILIPGQRLRVPAPTPTPTLSPTPSGSETPTPTPTATYNIPVSYSPAEGDYFDRNNLVTLRWSASGTLASNEAYLVVVRNLDSDAEYRTETRELFFVLLDEWQPRNGRTQEFEWTISIAVMNGDRVMSTREMTAPRHFRWQGQ
jgi:phage tail protein X